MKKRLKQVHYIALVLLFAVIAGMVLIENENFVGQALKGPLSIRPAVIPAVKTPAIATPKPCPAGSVEITQEDVDQALQNTNNHGYIITQPGNYCLKENIVVDGNALNVQSRGGLRVITIQSEQTILDLNKNSIIDIHGSKALAGSYGYGFDAISIWNPGQRPQGITVKNGEIKGFDHGLVAGSLGGLEDITAEGIIFTDNFHSLTIIETSGVVVKNNKFENTALGININSRVLGDSNNVLVEKNTLAGANRGIVIVKSVGVNIRENIADKLKSNPSTMLTIIDSPDVQITDNIINNHRQGLYAYSNAQGDYLENTFCNVATPVNAVPPAVLNDQGNNNFNAQNC